MVNYTMFNVHHDFGKELRKTLVTADINSESNLKDEFVGL